ncbi:hypothetical protein U1707_18270 [Sphingomonas sp. PB2P12]|uniref:hypothetical protein n=1 Tax=Sphingomonas sandaracina TaxID=3096157 RepID=UPI002FCA5E16
MADTDEARIIAWLDGELTSAEADAVAADVAACADLATLAERHRRLRARFAAAFDPLALAPTPQVISLADERAGRATKPQPRRWWIPTGAIAAGLAIVVALSQFAAGKSGRQDDTLAPQVAQALDSQLSGDTGAVRVALSFRDQSGAYCRVFAGEAQSGIACRAKAGWRLRETAPAIGNSTDYRMASSAHDTMAAVETMIAGDPLDRAGEKRARASDWR